MCFAEDGYKYIICVPYAVGYFCSKAIEKSLMIIPHLSGSFTQWAKLSRRSLFKGVSIVGFGRAILLKVIPEIHKNSFEITASKFSFVYLYHEKDKFNTTCPFSRVEGFYLILSCRFLNVLRLWFF